MQHAWCDVNCVTYSTVLTYRWLQAYSVKVRRDFYASLRSLDSILIVSSSASHIKRRCMPKFTPNAFMALDTEGGTLVVLFAGYRNGQGCFKSRRSGRQDVKTG